MNTVLKLVVGLVVPGFVLAGCTTATEIKSTSTASATAEAVDCDSPEVDPLTLLGDASLNSFLATCPTDKTTPEIASAALGDRLCCWLLDKPSSSSREVSTSRLVELWLFPE